MTALRHSWILTQRELLHWRREPWGPLFSLLFSLMTLLMFRFLFGGAIEIPGGGAYVDFLVPGLLALAMLFGVESTMTAVAVDTRRGVTDRLRSLPISAAGVPLARAAADLLSSAAQLIVLMIAGVLVGWRPEVTTTSAIATVALLLWLRLAVLWLGIWLGLRFRSEQAVVAVQVLVWPAAFLSGVFVPTDTMPSWLGAVAAWNPVSLTATAVRELVGAPIPGAMSGPAAMIGAVVLPAMILAVFVPLTARAFRTLSD
jgi:ABC-type polysaccharide/polyol phosphate export permease